jgi:hypothetical protein
MAKLAGPTIISAQDLYTQSSTPQHKVGQLAFDSYGNRYRYVKAGGTALVSGDLLQEPAENTHFHGMTLQAAAAIGSKSIAVTLGGTAVTTGLFDDGILFVSAGTGIGQQFRIVSHDIQTSTTGTCTFVVDRPVAIALTTASSKITVRKNPYKAVIQYPITTQTGGAVGIALYAMSANYYGWIQSGGESAVLFDNGTNTANGTTAIVPSAAVAGSVKLAAADGANRIGFSRIVASVDSTMGLAYLTMD